MAGREIDHLGDPSATDQERQRRSNADSARQSRRAQMALKSATYMQSTLGRPFAHGDNRLKSHNYLSEHLLKITPP
jgi:hypothetical protein